MTTTVARGTETVPPGEQPAGEAGRQVYLAAGCAALPSACSRLLPGVTGESLPVRIVDVPLVLSR